ncbi:MAG: NADH-quinone oxidoreductase subunit C [Gemmatimonadota bacterium]
MTDPTSAAGRQGFAARVTDSLGERVTAMRTPKPNRVFVEVAPEDNVAAARILFDELGGRLATVSGVDLQDAVEINYHFAMDADRCVVTLKVQAAKPDPHIESLAPHIAGASWIEREINDLIGCRFDHHPNLERLILADDWPAGVHPLSREFE